MLIVPVPVPAVVVNPVGAALLNAVAPELEIVKVPPLNVMFLVPVAVEADVLVKVKPAKFSVPFVSVNDAFIPASANVVVIPAVLIFNMSIVLPV